DPGNFSRRPYDPLGEQQPRREFAILSWSAHRDGNDLALTPSLGRIVQADLQRLFHRKPIAAVHGVFRIDFAQSGMPQSGRIGGTRYGFHGGVDVKLLFWRRVDSNPGVDFKSDIL